MTLVQTRCWGEISVFDTASRVAGKGGRQGRGVYRGDGLKFVEECVDKEGSR